MKKLGIVIAFILFVPQFASAGGGNDNQTVLLRWKLQDGQSIAFETNTDQVDPKKENLLEFDFEGLAKGKEPPSEATNQYRSLKFPSKASATTVLTKKHNGTISIKMILNSMGGVQNDQTTDTQETLSKVLKQMEGTVQLRAEIDEAGLVTSFYLEQKQKNLVALCFELPQRPVKPGDTWSVNANLIMMGSGFVADGASRSNQVRLISLSRSEDGDNVATLEYVIVEEVNGKFRVPPTGDEQPVSMLIGFYGQAKFLVNKGSWQEFKGRMYVKATGMMKTDIESNLTLIPITNVSQKMIELE